ncbi:MAG: diacylglycerol/lipid kinase family protein [Longimicrobiales bacterium]
MTDAAGRVPVFLNASAGTGSRSARGLYEHFGDAITISEVLPQHLHEVVARAAAGGVPIIGVAGGDGSQRTAAAALVHTQSALLCIPTGSLNTFARRHGIPDVPAAAAALRERRIDTIAVGTFHDGYFLNTLTFGDYARIVRRRERYRPFIGKWTAALVATAAALATLRSITVALDVRGERLIRRTPIVWVGVGWGSFPRLHDAIERRSSPDLEVVVLHSRTRRAAAACLFRLTHKLVRNRTPLRDPQLEVLHARRLTIQRPRVSSDQAASDEAASLASAHWIDATADGEVMRLEAPVNVGILDAALRVIHGAADPVAGAAAAARD